MNLYRTATITTLLCCATTSNLARAADPEKSFEFRDGDRIVLLGSTFVERMQFDGYLEALLTLVHPNKNLTFRNLGWSGDTVWGESRAVFGGPADGFARLVKDVREAKPTVLMICYGANEANAGPGGLAKFTTGLDGLLNALADTKARVILLSPPQRVRPSPRLPDPKGYNEVLGQYAHAIADTAKQSGAFFIDLTGPLTSIAQPKPLYAQDGVQLTPEGNYQCALAIGKALELNYRFPDDRAPKLRDLIREKNVLYFNRYRPENETYLFLFRKHEQGNNAVEIPQFDPLIADKEREIAKLRGSTSSG